MVAARVKRLAERCSEKQEGRGRGEFAVSGSEPQLYVGFSIGVTIKFTDNALVKGSLF